MCVGTARLADRLRLFLTAGEGGGMDSDGERLCFPPGDEAGVVPLEIETPDKKMFGDFGIPAVSMIPALLSSPVVGDSILIVRHGDFLCFEPLCVSLENCNVWFSLECLGCGRVK